MGRIVKEITIDGKKMFALFDSGSERTYILAKNLPKNPACVRVNHFNVALGGEHKEITERCSINAEIDKLSFDFSAHPVERLGEVDNKPLGAIIGATAMEEWNIEIKPSGKELKLDGLKKREFTEF